MAKYNVTEELASTLKSIRIQNGLSSKSVAEHIGKSQSYMSKLEKGDIKTIDESELTSIFHYLYGYDKEYQEFFDNYLSKIFNSLELKYTKKEIENQLWLENYDTVKRLIPIPEDMIDDITQRMDAINLTVNDLCGKINSNETIRPMVENLEQYPANEWQANVVNKQIKFTFIRMNVDIAEIKDILYKKKFKANYIIMLSIVYHLKRAEALIVKNVISDSEDHDIMTKSKEYLKSYKFYSLADKMQFQLQSQTIDEYENLISSFDKENIDLLREITSVFMIFSELDVDRTNKILSSFVENLDWDKNFILKLISMNFSEIGKASYTVKRNLISEIDEIIEKYKNLSESEKNIDVYD